MIVHYALATIQSHSYRLIILAKPFHSKWGSSENRELLITADTAASLWKKVATIHSYKRATINNNDNNNSAITNSHNQFGFGFNNLYSRTKYFLFKLERENMKQCRTNPKVESRKGCKFNNWGKNSNTNRENEKMMWISKTVNYKMFKCCICFIVLHVSASLHSIMR